ncbi:hypothetical protein GCM10010123_18070 [Pilimelia anulata]|uniref:Uncharacterized protein n=1 Tax=Pilimelia anulata TaxID=53371 RepID=A0A8J3FBZ9_9ACTN|nr:hypothetical protein [Pilimelia anulata]GGJ88859.1 hypothetical protein GCM10010123_18070 [Pilimelia anulata]
MTTTTSFDPATIGDADLTVPDLLTLWAQHCPAGYDPVFSCPGCQHHGRNLCPTAIAARTRLRAHLDSPAGSDVRITALMLLTYRQFTDLVTVPAGNLLGVMA